MPYTDSAKNNIFVFFAYEVLVKFCNMSIYKQDKNGQALI